MTEREWEVFLFKHNIIRKILSVIYKLIVLLRTLRDKIKFVRKAKSVKLRARRFHNYQNNKLAYFLGFWPPELEHIYEKSRIEFLYLENPALFRNPWRRATNKKARKRAEFKYETCLWITLNIVEVVRAHWRRCYYCWKKYTVEEFLSGIIEVEHMEPLSGSGKHSPPNIVTACSDCNRLKGNLADKDILEIFRSPETYFANRSYKSLKRKKLTAFAGMIAYGLVPDEEFYPAEFSDPRRHTEFIINLKSAYRKAWH